MPDFQSAKPKVAGEGEFKYQHNFEDGTVGRYETKEALDEAIEGENENRDRA
ncbi:MAG: hypothetical protein ACYC40_05110 [Patescibacteria group bacterium]